MDRRGGSRMRLGIFEPSREDTRVATRWPRRLARRIWRPKGRILQIRYGYNPNSSSLGADLQVLVWGAAAATIMTVYLSAMMRAYRRYRRTQSDSSPNSGQAIGE